MGKSGADRVRAARVRKLLKEGEDISDDDEAFFENYIGEPVDAWIVKNGLDVEEYARGRSQSASRTVHIEEKAASAEGDHLHPEAYAAVARSEGLRADTLLRISADAMVRVNEQHAALCNIMLQRLIAVENAHVGMMEAVRDSYLQRTEAEANAIKQAQLAELAGGDDELGAFMGYMLQAWEAKMERDGAGDDKKKKRKKPKPVKPLGMP